MPVIGIMTTSHHHQGHSITTTIRMHMFTLIHASTCITTTISSVAGKALKNYRNTSILTNIVNTLCIQTIASHGKISICRKSIAVILTDMMKNHRSAIVLIKRISLDTKSLIIRNGGITRQPTTMATARIRNPVLM